MKLHCSKCNLELFTDEFQTRESQFSVCMRCGKCERCCECYMPSFVKGGQYIGLLKEKPPLYWYLVRPQIFFTEDPCIVIENNKAYITNTHETGAVDYGKRISLPIYTKKDKYMEEKEKIEAFRLENNKKKEVNNNESKKREEDGETVTSVPAIGQGRKDGAGIDSIRGSKDKPSGGKVSVKRGGQKTAGKSGVRIPAR